MANLGKIQLLNGTWHFFYGGRMLNLKCSPRHKPSVSREQAANQCAQLIANFIRESDERTLKSLN